MGRMKRLTYKARHEAGYKANKNIHDWECLDKLGKLEDLEEKGKLLKLPCALGETVYMLEVDEENFESFHCGIKITESKFDFWMIPMVGSCIFLKREYAETALKQRDG